MTEIDETNSTVSRQWMEANGCVSNCHYLIADWLRLPKTGIPTTDGLFDCIISNPPFAMSGKQNRRYFQDQLTLSAHKHLRPGGVVIMVQSSMADLQWSLVWFDRNGFDAEVVHQTVFPWREYYFADPDFVALADSVQGETPGYHMANGRRMETLHVIKAILRPFP